MKQRKEAPFCTPRESNDGSRSKERLRGKCCSNHRLIRQYTGGSTFLLPMLSYTCELRRKQPSWQKPSCAQVVSHGSYYAILTLLKFEIAIYFENTEKVVQRVCKPYVNKNRFEHSFIGTNSRFHLKISLIA